MGVEPLAEQPPTNNDGGFTPQIGNFCNVGAPFVDREIRSNRTMAKGKRQFLTCPPKKGQTADNWGPGPRVFFRLSDNDPYRTANETEGADRVKAVGRYLHPAGFKYSHPMKKSSCPGDYEGTMFSGPCEGMKANLPEGLYAKRGIKTAITELLEKRNIQTNPIKEGGFGYHNTTIGEPAPYIVNGLSDPYDWNFNVATQERLQHYEKIGDRKPFKVPKHPLDYLDGFEHTSASKILSWDDKCMMRPHPPEYNLTPKERVQKRAEMRKHGVLVAGYKAFFPSSYVKSLSSQDGTFEPFTAWSADPYDDNAIVQSMKPDRHNPVKKMQEKYGMSEALRERKQWRPNSFRKSKMTPSTACMGINKHKI